MLDDSSALATRATQARSCLYIYGPYCPSLSVTVCYCPLLSQADLEAERRKDGSTSAIIHGETPGLNEELANTEKDDASAISTVMAVAMAGRAIRPSLDVLQQLVKAQREDVAEVCA